MLEIGIASRKTLPKIDQAAMPLRQNEPVRIRIVREVADVLSTKAA